MCELMSLSFSEPVTADFSIRPFSLRAKENADGWGMAWYPDRSLCMVKEPLSWRSSKYAQFLEDYERMAAHIFIAHVRKKTVGGPPTHADTHPFVRELDGREYCFAHNGTIAEAFDHLPLGRFKPIGSTDSEHVFCHLLEALRRGPGDLASREGWTWLHKKLSALNEMGKLNCLLSDGSKLLCYHDANGFKGLSMSLVAFHDHTPQHLADPTLAMDLASLGPNRGVVVATRPLTDKGWHKFHPGELLVLEKGEALFSSHRSGVRLGRSQGTQRAAAGRSRAGS